MQTHAHIVGKRILPSVPSFWSLFFYLFLCLSQCKEKWEDDVDMSTKLIRILQTIISKLHLSHCIAKATIMKRENTKTWAHFLFILNPKGCGVEVGDDFNKSWYHHIQVQQKYRLKHVNHFKQKHEIIYFHIGRQSTFLNGVTFILFLQSRLMKQKHSTDNVRC